MSGRFSVKISIFLSLPHRYDSNNLTRIGAGIPVLFLKRHILWIIGVSFLKKLTHPITAMRLKKGTVTGIDRGGILFLIGKIVVILPRFTVQRKAVQRVSCHPF